MRELGPGADQRLVRELDGTGTDGEQAGPGEPVEHLAGLVVLGGAEPGQQLLQRHRAAGVVLAVADADQAGEHLAGDGLSTQVQLLQGGVGGTGQRPMDAPGGAVSGQGQHVAFAVLPGDEQRVRQQGQHTGAGLRTLGLGAQVLQDEVDELGLQGQPGLPGGSFDGLPELGGGHGTDHHGLLQRGHQFRVGGAVPEEVGAYAENDDGHRLRIRLTCGTGGRRTGRATHGVLPAQRVQGLDEDLTLPFVGAGGEQFLELVDDDDRPPPVQRVGDHVPQDGRVLLQPDAEVGRVRPVQVGQAGGQRAERVGAGGQQDDLGVRGSSQACDQAGAQQGGLARPGRPGDHQGFARGGLGGHAVDERPGQLLAAEEVVGVVGGEGGQPAVRAELPVGGAPARRTLAGGPVTGEGGVGRHRAAVAVVGGLPARRGIPLLGQGAGQAPVDVVEIQQRGPWGPRG
ncbi:hypothetical protein GCM10010106_41850 [Thermopolyspora flexuosa]|nr:hypothetical protein GCM10010106_41850 [Thermopolyspora flexuosa]